MTADTPIPRAPKGLSRRSAKLWRDVLTAWELSEAEETVLENGLRLLDRADEAAKVLDDEGVSVFDRYGSPKAHPMCDVEVRCRRSFNDVMRQLGVRFIEEGGRASAGRPQHTAVRAVS